MIFKTIIICLLIVGVSLLVIDISERHSDNSVSVPVAPSVSPSGIFSSKEISYESHTSKTGRVVILNNSNARDVSYGELQKFLLEDQTDKIVYREDVFSCADYSELLQHNAENRDIRCAWVYVDLLETIGHSLNAFQTTDQGLIFVDDSGVPAGVKHPFDMDKTVILNRGSSYVPESLFRESGWENQWKSAGTVVNYKIFWTGDL